MWAPFLFAQLEFFRVCLWSLADVWGKTQQQRYWGGVAVGLWSQLKCICGGPPSPLHRGPSTLSHAALRQSRRVVPSGRDRLSLAESLCRAESGYKSRRVMLRHGTSCDTAATKPGPSKNPPNMKHELGKS